MDKLMIKPFGTTEEGEKCYLYTMKNDKGMEAVVSDYGATLVSLIVKDKDGNPVDVVQGYDTPAEYTKGDTFFGATVGRIANRIGGSKYELNGTVYTLAPNDNGNNLHSGPYFYNKRMWEVTDNADDHVTFKLHSMDCDQGYPGAIDIYVTYELSEDNTIKISYYGVPDKDTIINMTNHSYFNLNGHDSGTVLGHTLKLDADSFTPGDKELIPTGEIRTVEGSPMDFREGKTIGADIGAEYEPLIFGGGYDHNWVLKNEGRFDKVAEVTADSTGIVMEVYTDLPGVQVYTANFVEHEPGKGGCFYEKRGAVCLETQYFPDAVNHDNFETPLCKAGEAYATSTAYRFLTLA